MRKVIMTLGLFALALLACVDDASARGGRRGRGGCGDSGCNADGGGCYSGPAQCNADGCYAPGQYHGGVYGSAPLHAYGNTQFRPSFYPNPSVQQSATVTIALPSQDAEVWFDNAPTQQRGMQRTFHTPALESDGIYTVKARWMEDGRTVSRERQVQVRAGQLHAVDFRAGGTDQLAASKPERDGDSAAFPQEPDQPRPGKADARMPSLKIDGEWTPIYIEMDGKKVENKNFTNVTISNNVVTCRHEGKEKSIKLEFGPHHMVRCTMQNGEDILQATEKRGAHTHHGVYVAAQDYLSFSFEKGAERRSDVANPKDGEAQPRPAGRAASEGPSGADIVIILRRAGAANVEVR